MSNEAAKPEAGGSLELATQGVDGGAGTQSAGPKKKVKAKRKAAAAAVRDGDDAVARPVKDCQVESHDSRRTPLPECTKLASGPAELPQAKEEKDPKLKKVVQAVPDSDDAKARTVKAEPPSTPSTEPGSQAKQEKDKEIETAINEAISCEEGDWKDARQRVQDLLERRPNADAFLSVGALRNHCGFVTDGGGARDRNHTVALIWAASQRHKELAELMYVKDPSSLFKLLKAPDFDDQPESTDGVVVLRVVDMLPYLIRGEGDKFTDMVDSMMEKVLDPDNPDSGQIVTRYEKLEEPMRTILGSYDYEFQRAAKSGTKDGKEPTEFDAFHLKYQNLVSAPKVKTTLQKLRVSALVACKSVVLKAVAETANEDTLKTNTVEAITSAAWLQLRVLTALDIVLNALALGCLCLTTYGCRGGSIDAQPALWTLAAIHFKEAVEWIWQVLQFLFYCSLCRRRRPEGSQSQEGSKDGSNSQEGSQGEIVTVLKDDPKTSSVLKYELGEATSMAQASPSLETLADLLFLVAGYAAIVSQMGMCSQGKLDHLLLPWFSAMYWLRFVYSLRGELWLGPHLLPILSAMRDTVAFFFVTFLCIVASTHAYIILEPRGEDDFPLYSAFTHTTRLAMFGDFDMFEYLGQDPTYSRRNASDEWEPNDPSPMELKHDTYGMLIYMYLQALFFSTGIGVQVLLISLLTGILGSNYELHKDRARVLFLQARARMLLDHERRPWVALVKQLRAWTYDRELPTERRLNNELEDPKEIEEKLRHHKWCTRCARMLVAALGPLQFLMKPSHHGLTPEIPFRQKVFERFKFRFVWAPVTRFPYIAVVMPLLAAVLAVVSVVSVLLFWLLALVLWPVIEVNGLMYVVNLSVFGLFGDCFADECQIYALVREAEADMLEQVQDCVFDIWRTQMKQEDKTVDLEKQLEENHKSQKEKIERLEWQLEEKMGHLEKRLEENHKSQQAMQEKVEGLEGKLTEVLDILKERSRPGHPAAGEGEAEHRLQAGQVVKHHQQT